VIITPRLPFLADGTDDDMDPGSGVAVAPPAECDGPLAHSGPDDLPRGSGADERLAVAAGDAAIANRYPAGSPSPVVTPRVAPPFPRPTFPCPARIKPSLAPVPSPVFLRSHPPP
jgi:hypothetical protein